jgi:hypothetical protein
MSNSSATAAVQVQKRECYNNYASAASIQNTFEPENPNFFSLSFEKQEFGLTSFGRKPFGQQTFWLICILADRHFGILTDRHFDR